MASFQITVGSYIFLYKLIILGGYYEQTRIGSSNC